MALLISVAPATEGWFLDSETLSAPQIFKSGAKAESAAMRLAAASAEGGRSAEVRIFMRDGALAGRFLHPAAMGSALQAG